MNRYILLGIGALSLGPVSLLACSSIPDVQFVDDAVLDSGSSLVDATTTTDARASSDARPSTDGSTSATCPGTVPANASLCCGSIPCSGTCGDACSECVAKCSADEVCCAKKNVVLCRPKSSSAPCD